MTEIKTSRGHILERLADLSDYMKEAVSPLSSGLVYRAHDRFLFGSIANPADARQARSIGKDKRRSRGSAGLKSRPKERMS